MLEDKQAQLRGLVMGAGTRYHLMPGTDFWSRDAEGTVQQNAWSHGGWGGSEWMAPAVIPLLMRVDAEDTVAPGDPYGMWLEAHRALAEAFAPIGDGDEVELRWRQGPREYALVGRPRPPKMDTTMLGAGWATVRAAFVATDPLVYESSWSEASMGLPRFEGGVTFPMTFPTTIPGYLADGIATVVNEGTADTPLSIRIDGPVRFPRVGIQRPDGEVAQFTITENIPAGRWLDVDTAAGTVLLDGSPLASRRRSTVGRLPLLPPGISTVRFLASQHNDDARLTVRWRSAWW